MDGPQIRLFVFLIRLSLALLFAFLTGWCAGRKNRSRRGWAIAGFFLGPLSLLALAFCSFLCPKCKKPIKNREAKRGACPHCEDGVEKRPLNGEENAMGIFKFSCPHCKQHLEVLDDMMGGIVVCPI